MNGSRPSYLKEGCVLFRSSFCQMGPCLACIVVVLHFIQSYQPELIKDMSYLRPTCKEDLNKNKNRCLMLLIWKEFFHLCVVVLFARISKQHCFHFPFVWDLSSTSDKCCEW